MLCSANSALDSVLSKIPCGAALDKVCIARGEGDAAYQPCMLLQSTWVYHRITRYHLIKFLHNHPPGDRLHTCVLHVWHDTAACVSTERHIIGPRSVAAARLCVSRLSPCCFGLLSLACVSVAEAFSMHEWLPHPTLIQFRDESTRDIRKGRERRTCMHTVGSLSRSVDLYAAGDVVRGMTVSTADLAFLSLFSACVCTAASHGAPGDAPCGALAHPS